MPPPMTDCSDLSARSGSPLPATTGACTPRPTTTSQTPTAKSVTWRDSTGHSLCESSDSPPPEHTSSASPSAPPVPALPGGNAPSHLGLPLVTWSSGPNPIPRLRFQAVPYLLSQRQASRLPPHPSQAASSRLAGAAGSGKDDSMRLSYRVVGGAECHVVRATLAAHGFREAGPTQDDFNVMWSSGRVEMHEMRGLNRYQKVNRFPRTNEITRKDRLYLNISKMRQTYGDRHFDFMPPTFLLPQEYEPFYTAYLRMGGRWVVKPVASSQGRGIHVIDSLAELPSRLNPDDKYLIQKYIDNPLLLDGRKFDLRVYVAITSFTPLRIYMYEEGLTRVAADRYDSNPSTSGHSMRSSIHRQKGHGEEADEDGNNWSLSEVLRHVGAKYGADSASVIMAKIKDIIVKSILSGESTVSTAVNMFVQHSGNCFELLGFDILIDQNLQPWLLEVNMSPSLTCESPLDLKVKGSLIADLFTLIGIVPFTKGVSRKSLGQVKHCRLSGAPASVNVQRAEWSPASSSDQKLTPEQQKIVRIAREELTRRGSFSRVFPTDSSAYLYSPFIPKTSLNWSVLIALYGKTSLAKPKRTSAADEAGGGRSGGASPSPRFTSLSYLIADRPASGKKDGGSGRTVSQAVPNAPWASVHHRRDVRSEYGDALALASAAEPASGVIRGGSAGVGGGAKATDELLADASGILGGMAGGRAGSGRAGSETMTAKRLAEKIQAREAFHVFLENILNRIRKFYEQSDPDSEVDLNYVRQQVAVVDKFLAQASDLSLDPDSNEASVSIEPSEINDMPALTDRLDAFIRSYKRQTEKFKLECLANGRIHGTVNSWTPQSATSSRNSSRPGSASTTAGRTPLARAASIGRQMISDDDVSEGSSTSDPSERAPSEDSSTNTSQGHGSYGSSGLRTPERFPMRPVTVVTSANPFLDGGGSAGSTQGRRWASPALASPSLGSAFPVSYAWSAAHGGKRAKSGPLAASMAPPGAAKGAKTKQQSFLAIKGKSVYK